MKLGNSVLNVGLISHSVPYGHWLTSQNVKCIWVWAYSAPQHKQKNDPRFYKRSKFCPGGSIKSFKANEVQIFKKILSNQHIDFIIFENKPPCYSLFNMCVEKGLGIGWFESNNKFNVRVEVPWKLVRHSLSHAELGGVSTLQVKWCFCYKSDIVRWSWSNPGGGVKATLAQIIDTTIGGKKFCLDSDVKMGQLNTYRGLLKWNNRFGKVLVPTVYSKDQWVQRYLEDKELATLLDVPGSRTQGLDKESMKRLGNINLPGKIFNCACRGFQLKSEPLSLKKTLECDQFEQPSKRLKYSSDTEEKATNTTTLMTTVTAEAVKSDNAPIPEHLWDRRVVIKFAWLQNNVGGLTENYDTKRKFIIIRRFFLKIWRGRVRRSFFSWLKDTPMTEEEKSRNMEAGIAALQHVAKATWWKWDGGSSLFFWRWKACWIEVARDGSAGCFNYRPKRYMKKTKLGSNDLVQKIREKVKDVVDKGYITLVQREDIEALMPMFGVKKGLDDIRMVYNGSKSGLNDALYCYWFPLPKISTMYNSLMNDYWSSDEDYGEMFLNFPMHKSISKYSGVYLGDVYEGNKDYQNKIFGMWGRKTMGLGPSCHDSVQFSLRAKRIIYGDRHNPNNPFQWKVVSFNIPGLAGYDPRLPRMMKIRKDGRVASDLHIYIDDYRITAATEDMAWACSSRIGKISSYLGTHCANRKKREPSKSPGAWQGGVVDTIEGSPYQSVSSERWVKLQEKIRWFGKFVDLYDDVSARIDIPENDLKTTILKNHIPRKQAESYRGYLVYVSRTYRAMVPLLKGIHLSLDYWRPNRDDEGWRIMGLPQEKVDFDPHDRGPPQVPMVNRLRKDIKILMEFTSTENPVRTPVRPTKRIEAYMFGDASGQGFGLSLWSPESGTIHMHVGSWNERVKNHSSNYRETCNFVRKIEELVENGDVEKGSELWVFTDNFVFESCYSSGSASTKDLHELITRLRRMEMYGSLFIHVVWVAGTRMIMQGTDGLSRGDCTSGVLTKGDFLSYIPIGLSASKRSNNIREWWKGALPGKAWKVLDAEEWYTVPFEDVNGCYIWFPPPSLAAMALELLCESHQVHPNTSHVFIVPNLMTYEWRKQLGKAADCRFTLNVNSFLWSAEMHESLTVAFVCPYLNSRPWRVKHLNGVDEYTDKVCGMWGGNSDSMRSSVRKFWLRAWNHE